MAPRFFTPHNALADRLHDRRGLDRDAAVSRGNAAVRVLEPAILLEIDRALSELDLDRETYRASRGEAGFDLEQLYAAANTVAGLGAAAGKVQLGQAASSLCRLLVDEEGARPEAIAVHIEAMVLIQRDERLGAGLLAGLNSLGPTQTPVAASSIVATPVAKFNR